MISTELNKTQNPQEPFKEHEQTLANIEARVYHPQKRKKEKKLNQHKVTSLQKKASETKRSNFKNQI